MNLISYIKSHKLISTILLLVIILVIILPIYFTSNTYKSQYSRTQEQPIVQQQPTINTMDFNQLKSFF